MVICFLCDLTLVDKVESVIFDLYIRLVFVMFSVKIMKNMPIGMAQ